MTTTATMCVADGGLINPEAFPARAGDLDTSRITDSASTLRGFGTAVTEKTESIQTTWGRLNGPYQAPEQDKVYALMDPAVTSATDLKSTFDEVAGHLDTYAGTLDGLKTRLATLEEKAATFRASVINGVTVDASAAKDASFSDHMAWAFDWVPGVDQRQVTVPWNEDGASVDKNTELLEEYAGILADISSAAATAANAINGLLQNICVAPSEAIPAEAFTAPDAAMPWGSPTTEDRNCRESVGTGLTDFGTGLAEGAGMLVLGYNPDSGEFFTGTGWGQAWGGLGDLVGSTLLMASPVGWVAAGMAVTGNNDNDFSDWMYDRAKTVENGWGSLIGWDGNAEDGWHAWKEDGIAAGTGAVLNVGTFFIPGAGQIGAGLKGGGIAAKVARIAGAASEFAVQGGSWVVKGGVKVVTGLSHAVRFGLDDMLSGLRPGQVAAAGAGGVRLSPSGLLAMMDNGGHTGGHLPELTGPQRVSESVYGPQTHPHAPDWAGDTNAAGRPDVTQVPPAVRNNPLYDPSHPHYDGTPRGEHGNVGPVDPDVPSPSRLTDSGRLLDPTQVPPELQPLIDRGVVHNDHGVLRLVDHVDLDFVRKQPHHNLAEFTRQVELQEKSLNQMRVDDWQDRMAAFKDRVNNQAAYKQNLVASLADRLEHDLGISRAEAEVRAADQLDGQVGLHGPDQRGGGNPEQITGLGDSGVNSSIGSQWSRRHRSFVAQMTEIMDRAGIPPQYRGDVRMHVDLHVVDQLPGTP